MSFDALSWAAKQHCGSSGAKLVLLGLAECANRDCRAFPSIAELVSFSNLNRKSVISNIAKLEALGLVSDTGECVGRTKQVKVYLLNLQRVPKTEPVPKMEPVPKTELLKSPVFSAKSPKNGTRNKSEPTEAKASLSRKSRLSEGWQPSQFADGSKCRRIVDGWSADFRETQIEKFRAYHMGRGSVWVDWQQAWKTWVLNSPEFSAPSRQGFASGEPVPLWKHLSTAGGTA